MKISENFSSNNTLYLYITFCIFQSVFMSIIAFILQNDLAGQVLLPLFYTDEEIEAWETLSDLQHQIAYEMGILVF